MLLLLAIFSSLIELLLLYNTTMVPMPSKIRKQSSRKRKRTQDAKYAFKRARRRISENDGSEPPTFSENRTNAPCLQVSENQSPRTQNANSDPVNTFTSFDVARKLCAQSFSSALLQMMILPSRLPWRPKSRSCENT